MRRRNTPRPKLSRPKLWRRQLSRRTWIRLVALWLGALPWGLAHAAPESQQTTVQATESPVPALVAGVFDLAPYYLANNSEKPGLFVEALAALSARSGLKITIQVAPINRLTAAYRRGQLNFLIVLNDTLPAISAQTLFAQTPLVVLSRTDAPLRRKEDLRQKVVTAPSDFLGDLLRGYSYPDQPDIVLIRNYAIALNMLKKRRIDGVLGVWPALVYAAQQQNIEIGNFPLIVKQLDIVLSVSPFRDLPKKQLARLEKAQRALTADGTLAKIYTKYLGGGPPIRKKINPS